MKVIGETGEHTKYMINPSEKNGSMTIVVTRGEYTVTLTISSEDRPFNVKEEWETRNE